MRCHGPRPSGFAVQMRGFDNILTLCAVESARRRRYHPTPPTTRHQEGPEPNKLPRKRLK
jgi:hypothetical protein